MTDTVTRSPLVGDITLAGDYIAVDKAIDALERYVYGDPKRKDSMTVVIDGRGQQAFSWMIEVVKAVGADAPANIRSEWDVFVNAGYRGRFSREGAVFTLRALHIATMTGIGRNERVPLASFDLEAIISAQNILHALLLKEVVERMPPPPVTTRRTRASERPWWKFWS